MVFSSFTFLIVFLPAVLAAYYAAPTAWRNGILFFFSLIFYAWGEPVYVLLMIASVWVNYEMARRIGRLREAGGTGRARRVLAADCALNLGLLGFFKYTGLLPLPLGISFYTFQVMSYVIDVYRGEVPVQDRFLTLAAYVSLFPQLIAGPIVRYRQVAHELEARTETVEAFAEGVRYFCTGLGKKVLLANPMGDLYREICALGGSQSTATLWLGMLAFAFQIYFDFSGYSDMAVGLGRMFGFHFEENFNYPYLSRSITEFWRRWHISLGSWFRDYLYIPLGGNRGGAGKQVRNILIVWGLTGLWHGAGWNFLFWGLYFGILLILEKFFLKETLRKLPGFGRHLYTVFFVLIGWVLFSAEGLFPLWERIKILFFAADLPAANAMSLHYLRNYGFLFGLCFLGSTPCFRDKCGRFYWLFFLLSAAYLASGAYNPFLYFRF
ncbi:MAG: MBOAT family protein [Lachnospiraceae bacterium]|nr:MBOAT family protein [Lachnospiraceae bacterium]